MDHTRKYPTNIKQERVLISNKASIMVLKRTIESQFRQMVLLTVTWLFQTGVYMNEFENTVVAMGMSPGKKRSLLQVQYYTVHI